MSNKKAGFLSFVFFILCVLLIADFVLAAAVYTNGFTSSKPKASSTNTGTLNNGTGTGSIGDTNNANSGDNSDNNSDGNQDEAKYNIYLESLGWAGLEIVKLEGLPGSAAKGEPIEFTAEVSLSDAEEYDYENYYISHIVVRESDTGEDIEDLDNNNDGKFLFLMPGLDVELMFYIIPSDM